MSLDDLLGIATAVVISGTASSGLTTWMRRRHTEAETAEIVTKAAGKVVELQSDTIESLTGRVRRLERQHSEDRSAQVKHTAWDRLARQRLSEQGIDLPEPPPLYAPDVI